MKELFSKEEIQLINLLRAAVGKENKTKEWNTDNKDANSVLGMAKRHAVLSLMYDVVQENRLFPDKQKYIEKETKQIILQSYRLLFLTKYVVDILSQQGIRVVVLKGVATASFYPIPELRKSGDIDLLILDKKDLDKLEKVMTDAGFEISKEQHANHHKVFITQEGINIELHSMLAEPFADKRINRAIQQQMEECSGHIMVTDVIGIELPMLDKPYHAYELLLHMLQHFMYAGFGLKLLCDWIMIWRQNWTGEEKEIFVRLVKACGLESFAEALTAVCIKYLDMSSDTFAWRVDENDMTDIMLRELLDSEEFGGSDRNRMVMMSGTGVTAYIREFHHQMHLNFPKAGKCFLLWPVLWVITLVKFLRNNKKVRNTSTKEVLREAKRRSLLMKQLRLFC